MKLYKSTHSSAETEALANKVGKKLRGGEIIELISDLGGGKTTFVRGLAKGAGTRDHVSSPTFTISKLYKTLSFNIHHFDFYRIDDSGLLEYNIKELSEQDKQVVIVEWAGVVKHVLPEKRLKIDFFVTSENGRNIVLEYPKALNYLVEDL